MKTYLSLFSVLFFFFLLTSCSEDSNSPFDGSRSTLDSSAAGEFSGGGPSGGETGNDPEPDPSLDGLLTAAEWNDLANWDFWLNLIADTTYTAEMMAWGIDPAFYPGILPPANAAGRQYQTAFIVDATGSMGDELEYLKEDLEAVITEVETTHPSFLIETGAVFYRDQGEEYVTRHHDFTTNVQATRAFISAQAANGGGDWPEAVHSGLDVALNELSWSGSAGSKVAFLVLDAPPHNVPEVMNSYRNLVAAYAQSGIRIVPVVASGIDKSTEFLMRMTAIRTHGTYVFITDDSGIGGEHLEPTVGEYEVEFLSDLLVRLIGYFGGA